MNWGTTAFAEPKKKVIGKTSDPGSREPPVEIVKKVAIVLDMGEASREQGFRLNGCR